MSKTKVHEGLVSNTILVIGGMGSGKTTLYKALRKKEGVVVFESDQCASEYSESVLKPLRRQALSGKVTWAKHNALWFPMLVGGLYAVAADHNDELKASSMICLDHGGYFLLENRQLTGLVRRVFLLEASPEDIENRIKGRFDFQGEEKVGMSKRDYVKLALASRDSTAKAAGFWAAKGYSVTRLSGTIDQIVSVLLAESEVSQ